VIPRSHPKKSVINLGTSVGVLKAPYDKEYKDFVQQFAKLLKKIIRTIDKYGLRKRNLNKHKKDVKRFYKSISKQKYTSDLVERYKKRFEKNEDKLFTFLSYNSVPWNNNNAEHAIKHFAMYRQNVNGLLTEKGAEQYLVLLSIYQTCQYKNINFLQFLLSGKKDISNYKA
jgi:hypothetical protein